MSRVGAIELGCLVLGQLGGVHLVGEVVECVASRASGSHEEVHVLSRCIEIACSTKFSYFLLLDFLERLRFYDFRWFCARRARPRLLPQATIAASLHSGKHVSTIGFVARLLHQKLIESPCIDLHKLLLRLRRILRMIDVPDHLAALQFPL